MLGVDTAATRTDSTRWLGPGDLLLLYTDGLVEDRREPIDDGLTRLTKAAVRVAAEHPETLTDRLLGELAGRDDDVALLAVRIDAADGAPGASTPVGVEQ